MTVHTAFLALATLQILLESCSFRKGRNCAKRDALRAIDVSVRRCENPSSLTGEKTTMAFLPYELASQVVGEVAFLLDNQWAGLPPLMFGCEAAPWPRIRLLARKPTWT